MPGRKILLKILDVFFVLYFIFFLYSSFYIFYDKSTNYHEILYFINVFIFLICIVYFLCNSKRYPALTNFANFDRSGRKRTTFIVPGLAGFAVMVLSIVVLRIIVVVCEKFGA